MAFKWTVCLIESFIILLGGEVAQSMQSLCYILDTQENVVELLARARDLFLLQTV
jgi:hypothetical protein